MLMEKSLEVTQLLSFKERTLGKLQSPHHHIGSRIGVYIGCMYTEYLDGVLGLARLSDTAATSITGHGLSFMVGRLSFTFGWQGPCISMDTACSSSLVAVHLGQKVTMEYNIFFFFHSPTFP